MTIIRWLKQKEIRKTPKKQTNKKTTTKGLLRTQQDKQREDIMPMQKKSNILIVQYLAAMSFPQHMWKNNERNGQREKQILKA